VDAGSTFRFQVRLAPDAPPTPPASAPRPLLADRPVLVIADGDALPRHLDHVLRERGGRPLVIAPDAPLPTEPPPLTIVDLPDRESERRALLDRLQAWPMRPATAIVALMPVGQDAFPRAVGAGIRRVDAAAHTRHFPRSVHPSLS
jgi:hypothetical protein